MRIQPQWAKSTDQNRFPRDAGKPGRPGATQWIMRNSDGSTWETLGHYTKEEAKLFIDCEPLLPI